MNDSPALIHPAVLRYAAGDISASEAAEMMGDDSTVHDVLSVIREHGLGIARRGSRADEVVQLDIAGRLIAGMPTDTR